LIPEVALAVVEENVSAASERVHDQIQSTISVDINQSCAGGIQNRQPSRTWEIGNLKYSPNGQCGLPQSGCHRRSFG